LPGQKAVFGFGAHSGIDEAPELLRTAQQADRDALDIFSLSDHRYIGARLDAYASVGFVLGGTRRLAGLVNVTNLPLRPAPMLARTVTALSALSGGRIVLGMGAGGLWDRISEMGVPRLSPGDAIDALTVGGGIRSLEDMHAVLEAGAEKISLDSMAVRNPEIITEGAREFGRQAVVQSMQVRRVPATAGIPSGYEVMIDGARVALGWTPCSGRGAARNSARARSWSTASTRTAPTRATT
jgi:alkanesulfonate monooxygenase SsuD/methylene tetrahydromethanopterin reductase-like flavin-dependent oxidoreductase (luciferase family)